MKRENLWPVDSKALTEDRERRRDTSLARIRAQKVNWKKGFLEEFSEVCSPEVLGTFESVTTSRSTNEPIIQRLELYADQLEAEAAERAKHELQLQNAE